MNPEIGDIAEKRASSESAPGAVKYSLLAQISLLIFSLGVLTGMILVGGSIYADFESMLSNISIGADHIIRPVSCPILISTEETGVISVNIKNNSQYPINSLVQMQVKRGYITYLNEENERLQLATQESKPFEWEITAEDATFELVLVNVLSLASGDATHKGSCGILVMKLPSGMMGWQLFLVLSALSMLLMLIGLFLWRQYGRYFTGRYLETTRSFLGLMVVVLSGLICSLISLWEISSVFFYISVLMVGVIVPHFVISRRRI